MSYYKYFRQILPELESLTKKIEELIKGYDNSLIIYNPFDYGIECYLDYLLKYLDGETLPEYAVVGLKPC